MLDARRGSLIEATSAKLVRMGFARRASRAAFISYDTKPSCTGAAHCLGGPAGLRAQRSAEKKNALPEEYTNTTAHACHTRRPGAARGLRGGARAHERGAPVRRLGAQPRRTARNSSRSARANAIAESFWRWFHERSSATSFTLTGRPPVASSQARMAAANTTTPALSSTTPRPKRRPPSPRVGSKGGECQRSSRPGGWTS